MDIKLIIKELKYKNNLTQEAIGKELGVTKSTVNQLASGLMKPSSELLSKITKLCLDNGISIDNNLVSEPQEHYGNPKPNTLKTKGVPIYNVEFNAGLLPLSTEYVHFDEFIIGYCDFPEVQGADLITKMRGNSMTGVLENGDWISFRKLNSLSVINYGHIFGIITNDKVPLIKYVRKGPNEDILILKSHNPAFDDIELPKSEILAMFMVIDKVQITALAN